MTSILAKSLIIALLLINKIQTIKEDKINKECMYDKDCDPPFLICHNTDRVCRHKKLFPMELSEFIGFVIIAFFASLAAAAGIGGGIIVISIALLMFGVSVKEAVALSNIITFLNATIKYSLALGKKDSVKKVKTLINYSFVLLFNPVFVFSNVIGSMINKMIPGGVVLIMLILILFCSIMMNLRNAIKKYKKESKEARLQKKEKTVEKEQVERVSINSSSDSKKMIDFLKEIDLPMPLITEEQLNDKELQKVFKYQNTDFDPIKWTFLLSTVIVVVLFAFLRGNSQFDSIAGIEFCGRDYWILLALLCVLILIIGIFSTIHVNKEISIKKKYNHLMEHEMDYSLGKIILFNIGLFVVGVFCNIMGLGGSIIIFPLFTGLGMQPLIISFTSLFMAMLSKIAAVLLNMLSGLVIYDLALLLTIIMTICSSIMIIFVNKLLKRYKRQSIIIIIMVCVQTVALILAPIYAILQGSKSEDFWEFKSFC